MSFLKKTSEILNKAKGKPKAPLVTAEDLVLGSEIATDVPGRTLKLAKGSVKEDLDIVGESFRQDNIRAIRAIKDSKFFQIYLVPEPNNPHDKNAVGVWAGGVQVGYIGKAQARKMSKICREAFERNELITGEARCLTGAGGNWGVFGYAYLAK